MPFIALQMDTLKERQLWYKIKQKTITLNSRPDYFVLCGGSPFFPDSSPWAVKFTQGLWEV